MSTPEHHTTRSSPNTADTVIVPYSPGRRRIKRERRVPNQTNRYVNTPKTVKLDKRGREIPIDQSEKEGRDLIDDFHDTKRRKIGGKSRNCKKSRKNRTKKSFWKKWFGM